MRRIISGDAIKVKGHFASPSKVKILICVSPSINAVLGRFFVVNSDPYRLASDAQLTITRSDLGGLDRPSHIDTSKLVSLQAMETQGEVDKDARCYVGKITDELKSRIVCMVQDHGIMPRDQLLVLVDAFHQ